MKHLKAISISILVAFTPAIFLYSHNVYVVNLGVLTIPLFISALFVIVLYGLFFLFQRNSISASLSTVVFLVCNYLYGMLYTRLIAFRFQVENFWLLPVVIFIACLTAYLLKLIPIGIRQAIQNIILTAAIVVVGYNVILTIPAEIQKANLDTYPSAPGINTASLSSNICLNKCPDIYYIIFDSYAGFDAIREYWHEDYVNLFASFLKANSFFVAEKSHSNSIGTIHEIASRLNLKLYPWGKDDTLFLYKEITDSRVMRLFKSYGYTTVVINRIFPKFNADYSFSFGVNPLDDYGVGADEYQKMLVEGTMLNAFSDILQNSSSSEDLKEVQTALAKISNLQEIESPKFVYAHIPFPHPPFIVDKDGNVLDEKDSYNWNYYLGQHMYATKQAKSLVTRLLANANPGNPPVIILQSDHGARNQEIQTLGTVDNIVLENYPDQYRLHILNALYLPRYDTSKLPDDMDPIDTFVIVMNYYLNAGLTADKTQPK